MTRLPIEVVYQPGQTLYAVIRGVVSGTRQYWNTTLNTGAGGWEAFNSGHWAAYAIALTEDASTGYYAADYPAGIAGVLTSEAFYQQAGGSPALGDAPAAGLMRTQGQNIAAVDGDADVQSNLQRALKTEQRGALTGSPTTTILTTDVASAVVDAYMGRVLIFSSGPNYQVQTKIQSYDGAGIFVLSAPLPYAPTAGDTFIVV